MWIIVIAALRSQNIILMDMCFVRLLDLVNVGWLRSLPYYLRIIA
jgi:hypothetical protein